MILLWEFFTPTLADGLHRSLSDSKSPRVSRDPLRIQANLSNAVVWMFSTCPQISKSSSPFTISLGFVPRAPIKTGITVTFLFYSFFSYLAGSKYLSLFSPSFIFTLWSSPFGRFFSYFLLSLGLVVWLWLGEPFVLLFYSFESFSHYYYNHHLFVCMLVCLFVCSLCFLLLSSHINH